jgi:hypothetical protein
MASSLRESISAPVRSFDAYGDTGHFAFLAFV